MGIRKPLPHFGSGYLLLCFLCLRWGLPFLPQLWSLCFAEKQTGTYKAALDSETARSLRINKYGLSCSSSSIAMFCNCFCYCGYFKRCWEEKSVVMEVTTHHAAFKAMVPHWQQICTLWYLNTTHKPRGWASEQTHSHTFPLLTKEVCPVLTHSQGGFTVMVPYLDLVTCSCGEQKQ